MEEQPSRKQTVCHTRYPIRRFMEKIERIDLHLPKGWNAMTVEEMEVVAKTIMDCVKTDGAEYMKRAKIELFLRLSGLEVAESACPEKPVEEQYIVVKKNERMGTFILYLWQMHYWIEELMGWLDERPKVLRFPYQVHRVWRYGVLPMRYEGPGALMQDFSWTQYRIAGEYLNYYVSESNRLNELIARGNASELDLRKQTRATARAKALFLATLYRRKVKVVDEETRLVERKYAYLSSQSIRNMQDFISFSDVKFQVVLFWWTGMMGYLQKKFPRVFKESDPKRSGSVNPLEIYTRTTATMEKYLGIHEKELGRETYTNVLQHLNDMMEENEKLNKK